MESWGTYGLGQGQYANATLFGVDPSDGSVYIGDMTEKTAGSEGLRENFRIQKFAANGAFQASVLVPRFYDPPTNEEIATLFGIAVDPGLHRLYLLEGAKDPTTKEPYGQRILVYSTTPEGTKLVPPSGGPTSIALPTTGTERILNPTSIAVDPKNHEIEILGESFETEIASRHPVLQRVTSTGTTGPRFTDTGNKLKPALEAAKMITIAPTGTTYALTGRATKGTKTKLWELPESLAEIKETAGFAATATAEEWTFGLEQKVSTFTGGPELAISPDGETLYWKERIEAWSPPTTAGSYLIHGYSLKANATTVDYGGATSGSCKITSADSMFGVTGEGASEKVVVLDPGQPNEEEQQAPAFGGKVLTFGRGGTGCPVAEGKFKVNGVEENSEFAKGTTVTFDASSSVLTSGPTATKGFVKEVIWKFGDGTETIKTSSGTTEAALTTTHAYTNGGTYKPTVQIRFKKPTYGNPAIVEHTVVVTGGGGTEEFALKATKEGSGTITSAPSGINCGSTCEAKFAKGTLVKLTGTPESGFKSPTWTGCDAVTGGVCEVTMSSAKSVKATFPAIVNFTLKVTKEGSGTVTSSPAGINCGPTCEASFTENTLVKLTGAPETGFKAATWTGCDAVVSGVCEVTMSAAKNVKATFAAIPQFLLKVKKEGNGSGTVTSSPSGINCGSGSGCEASFAESTLVKLTATPESGSKAATFTGCDAVTGGVCEVTMNAAKEVKATFALEEFALKVSKEGTGSVTSSPGGINCGSECQANFTKGTLVKLTGTPGSGFKAATWTGCDAVTSGVCEVTVNAAKEVKATFAAIPNFLLKVKKEGNGSGTITSSPSGINCGSGSGCEASFAEGTLVKLTGTPAAGSKAATFTGCDAVTGGVCEVTMSAAKEVKATFALEEFALKVTKEGSGTVTSSPSGINCGTECEAKFNSGTLVKLTGAPETGFKAATWTGCDTVTSGVCEVTMSAAKEVKATFAAIPAFLLKVKKEGNGSGTITSNPSGINCGSGSGCEASFAEGTLVKLTAAPDSGSKAATFTGCDKVTSGVCEVTMSAAKEVKATFVLEEFALKVGKEGTGTVTSSPSGINCGPTCEAKFNSGTLVKLTGTPGAGFKGVTWSGCDAVTSGVCEVTINEAAEVEATFVPVGQFILKVKDEGSGSGTVTSNPSGINCGPNCEASFAEGAVVKLTATPDPGSKAATFTGCDAVTGGVCEVTMNAAKEVKATFAAIPQFLLKVKDLGSGSGAVTSSPSGINCGTECEASYTEGTLVKLTAAPGPGSKFAGWTGCDAVTSGICEVTMSAAKEVKATFELEVHTLKVTTEGTGTVASSPTGINCGSECEATFTQNTVVKLTGTPGSGFRAPVWTGCDTVTSGVCEVTINAAKEVKATFVPVGQFLLKVKTAGGGSGSVTSSPSGINCGSECEASYAEGTLVKLTGTPESGSKAAVFAGCDSVTGGVCEVTMNAAKNVTATFELESTSPVDCSGSDLSGAGSTLQGTAQNEIWIPGFKALCPALTVNYEASSSAAGLTAWGFKGGSFDKSKEFIGTDEAPDPTEIAKANTASGSKVLTVPVAQTAIGIVVNPPTGCTISGLTNKQLESIMRGNIKIWNKIQTASGAGCINAPITRVVRADASGTTYQMKNYLFKISEAALACTEAPGKNWKQLEDSGATGQPNTVWPQSGVNGCSATQLSPVVTGTGGAGVVKKVNTTEGSIGYAALPDIEANKNNAGENPNGDTNWVALQDNGLSNKLAIAKFASPASGSSANCSEAQYPVPTSAQTTSKEPANADWSQIFGGNTNAAAISPGAYSLCALTYDIALTNYSKAGFTAGQEVTAHSYLAEYLTGEAGQTALEAAGKYYAPLPDGGNPLHDIIGAAHYAASKIGF